jgi:succinate dehydrogenase / fumarate reductase, cytochrome b subunit
MSVTNVLPVHNAAQPACTCRHRWCPRRIHAALALLVLPFVVVHLAIALMGLWPARYQSVVTQIHRFGPVLPAIEIVAVFLPLLVQSFYGLRMLAKVGMKYHTDKKSRGGHLRFYLQRLSALFLLLFIGFHVLTMHTWFPPQPTSAPDSAAEPYRAGERFDPTRAFATTAGPISNLWGSASPWHPLNACVAGFYAAGIWAIAYHLANGLATAAMAWGFTVTAWTQRAWTRTCACFGAALTIVGTIAWCAFVFHR